MRRGIRKPDGGADLLSSFLASTCALTIGLNLTWSSGDLIADEFSEAHKEDVKAVLYLVAIPCAQWSGLIAHLLGSFHLMMIGVYASVIAGALTWGFPCHALCVYAARALQGLGCASLAVAVPNYVAENTKDYYQNAMLCLTEVFMLTGTLITYSLTLLGPKNQINILMTCVVCLNVLTLLLISMTSHRNPRRTPRNSRSSRVSFSGYLDDHDVSSKNESVTGEYKRLFTDKKHRSDLLVSLALFAFRDFCGIHIFKKSIHCVFNKMNTKPVTYEQCALVVTTLQLIFTTMAVFVVEIYGKRKLMLISSLGMLLSMIGMEMIIWNQDSTASEADLYIYQISVLHLVVIFFAHGLGCIPWAMQFETNNQKVKKFATGLIVSGHFLFLMIVEFSYMNASYILYCDGSVAAFWFIFLCVLQTIFVNQFVLEPNESIFNSSSNQ